MTVPLSPHAAVRRAEDWGTRTNERKVAGARQPLTGPGGQPLPSIPVDRTVINPLSPDAAVRRAEDWGTRTNERKVAGLKVGR